MKQRAVVFFPGLSPYIKGMDLSEASKFVGGYSDQTAYYICGTEVIIYSASKRAERAGQAPNRIVDGRVVYGSFVVVGMEPLTAKQAQDIADSQVWMMVQMEVAV